MVKLWSVNRWLRWTGFRLFVDVDLDLKEPTKIGFRWVGLYGSKGWLRLEPRGES